MKILESAPTRYDRGIRLLTLGRLDHVYDRLTSWIKKGDKVLDIGCGTGALTLRAGKRGAKVKGIDINPELLKIAKKRVVKENLAQDIELCEMGIAELDGEELESYDVVMCGLSLSELTEDELSYALKEIKRVLRKDGLLLVADEVKPKGILKNLLHCLIRFPLVIITYLLTQTTTHPIKDLPKRIEKAGFKIESLRSNRLGSFLEIIARKKDK